MKIFIVSALALCAVPAMAQVPVADVTANVGTRAATPRAGDVATQIAQDLGELIDALNKPNANFTALPYVYGARVGYFGSNEWAPRFTADYAGAIRVSDVKILEQAGKSAKATVSYELVFPPSGEALMSPMEEALRTLMKDQQETLDFKLVQLPLEADEQKWQIVPPTAKPLAIEEGSKNVLWANISYYIAQKESYQPERTPAERSISNLKQVGLGALMFVQDYDGIYAFESRYISEAISPYVSDKMVFQVPDTNEIYALNGNISGLHFERIPTSNKTVLFYEGQNEKPTFRYDGKAAICFADGHVALVSPKQAEDLIWKP